MSTIDVDSFRKRLRAWLPDNLPRLPVGVPWDPLTDDDDRGSRARELQRMLWDGGFAGLCYPREYGGQGLTGSHQRVFDEETAGYELPYLFAMPTSSVCGPVILEYGTEEQKRRYIPAFLRGDELWVQLLSEPTGGSDLAGALTRASARDGGFRLTGSKIWSSGAYRAEYGLCLARTNWDVPKYRGLTMFVVPLTDPRVTIRRITMVDGTADFCEEFFDDVPLPAENVVGKVDDGWTVASRMLYHERTAMGGSSAYLSVPRRNGPSENELLELAVHRGRMVDPEVRSLLGWAATVAVVQQQLRARVGAAVASGDLPAAAGSLLRLFAGLAAVERATIGLRIAGDDAVAYRDGDPAARFGLDYLARQARSISGGTVEMSRNVISERLLGMPREAALDRDLPFTQVRTNQMAADPGA